MAHSSGFISQKTVRQVYIDNKGFLGPQSYERLEESNVKTLDKQFPLQTFPLKSETFLLVVRPGPAKAAL